MRIGSRLLVVALATAGCSLAVDPKKLDPHAPPDVATFCQRALDLVVQRFSACGAATPELIQSQLYLPCQDQWQHALGRGNAGYDKYAAADCLAAVEAAPCKLLLPPNGDVPDVCNQVMSGYLNDAVACDVDADCGSGLCLAAATCPGVCAQRSGEGAACSGRRNVGPQCHRGLVCRALVCEVIIYQGSSCTGRAQSCEPGAYCEAATGTCEWQKGAGATCAGQEECEPGLLCAVAQVTPLRLECMAPRPPGASCTVGQRDCTRGSYCRSAAQVAGDPGTCVAWPGLGACDLAGVEPFGCLGRWCNMSGGTGACSDFTPEASSCASDAECRPGAVCNGLAVPGPVCFTSCMP
ncbi:MAG TPA: hypothetical protein VH880_11820 [Anaeromyxobacteraceae bacterium]|jgi:hypothetical protein